MCLIKNQNYHPHNRPLIAKGDIVCYKILTRFYDDSPDLLRTPVQHEKIRIQVYLDHQIPFIAKDECKLCSFWRHKLGFSNKVTDGFIHTLSVCMPLSGLSLFKCIIPKGTKYFIGVDHDYASEQIIFVEQLQ